MSRIQPPCAGAGPPGGCSRGLLRPGGRGGGLRAGTTHQHHQLGDRAADLAVSTGVGLPTWPPVGPCCVPAEAGGPGPAILRTLQCCCLRARQVQACGDVSRCRASLQPSRLRAAFVFQIFIFISKQFQTHRKVARKAQKMLACSSSEDPFKFCQLPQSCPLRQSHPPPSPGASRGRGSGSPPSEDSPVPLGIRDRVPVKSECPGFGFADTPEQTQAAGAAARGGGGGVLWAVDVSLCHSWGRSPGRLSSGLPGSPWKGHSSRVLCGARGPASVRCHCYWVSSQVVAARERLIPPFVGWTSTAGRSCLLPPFVN